MLLRIMLGIQSFSTEIPNSVEEQTPRERKLTGFQSFLPQRPIRNGMERDIPDARFVGALSVQ